MQQYQWPDGGCEQSYSVDGIMRGWANDKELGGYFGWESLATSDPWLAADSLSPFKRVGLRELNEYSIFHFHMAYGVFYCRMYWVCYLHRPAAYCHRPGPLSSAPAATYADDLHDNNDDSASFLRSDSTARIRIKAESRGIYTLCVLFLCFWVILDCHHSDRLRR